MNFLLLLVVGMGCVSAQQVRQPQIISLTNDINPDGSFSYSYQTEDGIVAQAQGLLKNAGRPELEAQSVQGQFSFTAPDGIQYAVRYTADENGFQAVGDHLPTPPPIPLQILRSLQQNPETADINGERFIQPRVRLPVP